jgi:hypothetical protein
MGVKANDSRYVHLAHTRQGPVGDPRVGEGVERWEGVRGMVLHSMLMLS